MVKSAKKSRSPLLAPNPSQRQPSKYTATKVSKKSEKSKTAAPPTTNVTKGSSSKSKSQNTDADAPTSSKQSTLTAGGNATRQKPPSKTPLGGAWKRVEKKKDQSINPNRKPVRNPKRLSPARSGETKSLSPPRPTSESSHTEELSTFEDAEISSFNQTGIIRYSDVLKSRNVPSSISLRPPIIQPSPSPPTGNVTNEAAAIDLEYFPELGQHRTYQNGSSAAAGNNRYPRKAASIAIVENPESCCSPENLTQKPEISDEKDPITMQDRSNEDVASESSNQTIVKCHQCQLNAQRLERVIQNSSTPFSINIPEFNFSQPDVGFPRFLMQFEDENYLKAENMALLGLKLALGSGRQH